MLCLHPGAWRAGQPWLPPSASLCLSSQHSVRSLLMQRHGQTDSGRHQLRMRQRQGCVRSRAHVPLTLPGDLGFPRVDLVCVCSLQPAGVGTAEPWARAGLPPWPPLLAYSLRDVSAAGATAGCRPLHCQQSVVCSALSWCSRWTLLTNLEHTVSLLSPAPCSSL